MNISRCFFFSLLCVNPILNAIDDMNLGFRFIGMNEMKGIGMSSMELMR